MPIKIQERNRPFTHTPGQRFVIPFTGTTVRIYPTAFEILGLGSVPLNILGPVQDFTAMLDLERGAVKVFGKAPNGYFCYWIFGQNGELYFHLDRGNPDILPDGSRIKKAESLPKPPLLERISFGITKTQEFERIKQRKNLSELLPIWFAFGQMIAPIQENDAPSLYQELVDDPSETHFLHLFDAGFSGVFHPEGKDLLHLGYPLPPLLESADPLILLSGGYQTIRSLFFQEDKNACHILPQGHALFKAGRVTQFKTSFGLLHLEWTKGFLRKMHIQCTNSGSYQFFFPKGHKSCRLKNLPRQVLSSGIALDLRSGSEYFFDHFQE